MRWSVFFRLPNGTGPRYCAENGTLKSGVLAGLGFMLPGFVLMFLLSWIYLTLDLTATAFQAVFLGIQPAVIALIVRACHRIGGHCLTDAPLWIIGVLAGRG